MKNSVGSVKTSAPRPGIAVLTLDDAGTRNAMSDAMASEFEATAKRLATDSSLRAVVLTGEGEAFSGGGHLDMLFEKTKKSEAENRSEMLQFYRRFLSIRSVGVPVVAALNGHAMGASLCLALACDIRLAADEAKLGLNFVRIGLHPGMGATFFLPELIGAARAADLLLRGSTLTAQQAMDIGLVSAVVPKAKLLDEALEVATSLARSGPQSVRELVATLRGQQEERLMKCLEREASCQAKDYAGKEFAVGIAAAREKRAPNFS